MNGEVLPGNVSSLKEDIVVPDDVSTDVEVRGVNVLSLEEAVKRSPRRQRSVVLTDLVGARSEESQRTVPISECRVKR